MKRILKIIGISILILLLFRGFFFRLLINYKDIGTRAEIEIMNQKLLAKIDSKVSNKGIELEEIIGIANSLTTEELEFIWKKASGNPNKLIEMNQANCIGYSAMFNSITNYLIRKNKYRKTNNQIEFSDYYEANIDDLKEVKIILKVQADELKTQLKTIKEQQIAFENSLQITLDKMQILNSKQIARLMTGND